jgi:hypothetical protein
VLGLVVLYLGDSVLSVQLVLLAVLVERLVERLVVGLVGLV